MYIVHQHYSLVKNGVRISNDYITIFYTEILNLNRAKNDFNFILKQVEDITIQLGKREEELAQAMMKVKKYLFIFHYIYIFKNFKISSILRSMTSWPPRVKP